MSNTAASGPVSRTLHIHQVDPQASNTLVRIQESIVAIAERMTDSLSGLRDLTAEVSKMRNPGKVDGPNVTTMDPQSLEILQQFAAKLEAAERTLVAENEVVTVARVMQLLGKPTA